MLFQQSDWANVLETTEYVSCLTRKEMLLVSSGANATLSKMFRAVLTKNTASYLTTSRRIHPRCRRKDVHHRRACYCLRCFSKCALWANLLDNHIVLTQKAWPTGQAFCVRCAYCFSSPQGTVRTFAETIYKNSNNYYNHTIRIYSQWNWTWPQEDKRPFAGVCGLYRR